MTLEVIYVPDIKSRNTALIFAKALRLLKQCRSIRQLLSLTPEKVDFPFFSYFELQEEPDCIHVMLKLDATHSVLVFIVSDTLSILQLLKSGNHDR